jgi:hypothetical protein
MQQGYSGSTVRRSGDLVEKVSSDGEFCANPARQRDLIALSRRLGILPRIERIDGAALIMAFIAGEEGLTRANAARVGQALRVLHAERGYAHPCMTGMAWLLEAANARLGQISPGRQLPADFLAAYPADALIHSEPVQLIEQADGSIVFIDFEGIGMGSKYQDLGFVEYIAALQDAPEMFGAFLEGYGRAGLDLRRMKQAAGVVALAYARFYDAEKRTALGLRLLAEAERGES